jgi:hypothetical protein
VVPNSEKDEITHICGKYINRLVITTTTTKNNLYMKT